jgi:AraC-like DNA-binding protein
VRVADGAEDYAADPVDSYLELPNGLVFRTRDALWGFALWACPSPEDIGRVVPFLRLELEACCAPTPSLVDLTQLDEALPISFAVLVKFLREEVDLLDRAVTRVAVVRPRGLMGMMVAGFHHVVGARYPFRVFSERAAAAAWLERGHLAADLDEMVETATRSAAIARLRRWLDEETDRATLDSAARAIGRAPRSLQRDLKRLNSSFQRELEAARIRRAKHLLARTESTLTAIAYAVGCASPQHFSVLFRRCVGMPPSAWRATHRAR